MSARTPVGWNSLKILTRAPKSDRGRSMSKVLRQLFGEELERSERNVRHLRLVPPPPPPPDLGRFPMGGLRKPKVRQTRLYVLFGLFLCVAAYSYWLITEGRRIERAVTYQRKAIDAKPALQGVKSSARAPLAEPNEERVVSEAVMSLNREGMEHFKKKNYAEAVVLFTRSNEIDPMNPLSMINLGMTLSKSGRLKEAKEILVKAGRLLGSALPLAGSPKLEVVYNNLGVIGIEEKSYGPAILQLQKAVQFNPDYEDARLNLAKAMELAGRPADAAREYQEFIDHPRLNPELKPAIRKRLAKLNAFLGYLKEEEAAIKAEHELLHPEDSE
jgi:tetratricopeptide (TPR) repeat protein